MRQASRERRIEVQLATEHGAVPTVIELEGWTHAALDAEDRGGEIVCVRVVDEDEARELNARYRGNDRATNVLSFPADADGLPADCRPLGDILLCAPVVAREAAEQGKPEPDHWAHLVVHGVLHLLGYDHQTEDEARAMEGREIDVLERLGIPNPYDPTTAAGPRRQP